MKRLHERPMAGPKVVVGNCEAGGGNMTTFLTVLLALEVGAVVDMKVGAAGAVSVRNRLPDVGEDDMAVVLCCRSLVVDAAQSWGSRVWILNGARGLRVWILDGARDITAGAVEGEDSLAEATEGKGFMVAESPSTLVSSSSSSVSSSSVGSAERWASFFRILMPATQSVSNRWWRLVTTRPSMWNFPPISPFAAVAVGGGRGLHRCGGGGR